MNDDSVSKQFVEEVVCAFNRMQGNGSIISHNVAPSHLERVPLESFCKLLQQMELLSGEPDIGLLLGAYMEPTCFSVLGHLVMASNTVGEALRYVAKLQPLVIEGAQSGCCVNGDLIEFTWAPKAHVSCAEKTLVDLVLSATRHFGIWVTGIEEPFVDVRFQYAAQTDKQACLAIFGHQGSYNQTSNGFSIPLDWDRRPIRSANNELKPIIYHRAEQLLKERQAASGFIARLISVLEVLLPQHAATIDRAAMAMNMSPRTLQRHLQEESTHFSEVLQRVRFNKATELLKETQLPLIEVAAMLGYREQSSFSSAYKSWSGQSPNQIRARQSP